MIIIRHKSKPKQKPNIRFFLIDCECGCLFACTNLEFTKHEIQKTPFPRITSLDIKCPECNSTIHMCKDNIMSGKIVEITQDDYTLLKQYSEVQK